MEEWVLQKVLQNFNGELVTDDYTREASSIDASIFKIKPAAIAIPRDVEGLKTLVRNVHELAQQGVNISITPRGAGSSTSGASLTDSIVVDLKPNFSWIGDLDIHEKTVWVGAGTYFKDLEMALAPHNLEFPSYPTNKDVTTIGGMLGNNVSGEKSIKYGATIDNVVTVRMVCTDGNEYEFTSISGSDFNKKVKLDTFEGYAYRELDAIIEDNWDLLQKSRPKVRTNSAGYALWRVINKDQNDFNVGKLLVGTQGTFGVITAVKLRLIEKLKHTRMLLVPVDDLVHLATSVQTSLGHHPESIEVYDEQVYALAEKYMPEDATNARAAKGHAMIVMIQFREHTKDQTDHYAEVCQKALERKKFKVTYVTKAKEVEAHWNIRRAAYKLLKDHAFDGKRAIPCIEDTIVSTDHFGEFLAAWQTILAEYGADYAYFGHVGDGNLSVVPLIDMQADDAPNKLYELTKRTNELVCAFGGSISAGRGDGLMRTPYLELMYGIEVMEVFAQLRNLFDPLNVFNAGKKLGADEDYARAHLIRSNS